MKKAPPKYAHRFLHWFCREDFVDEIEGDLLEIFQRESEQSSRKAKKKFIISVLRHLRPEYMKFFHRTQRSNSTNNIAMLNNYLILAFRNMKKRASFSMINIFGLAMGLSACLIILHYIDFETSYDNFNVNKESIYRMHRTIIRTGQSEAEAPKVVVTTYGLGPALLNELPEVKNYVRMHDEHSVVTFQAEQGEAKTFHEDRISAVDSTFFAVFTFQGVSGDLNHALDQPNTIVLTEKIAEKYFGEKDPIGQRLSLAGGRLRGDYTVTAVMKNIPQNTHFTFNMLVPMYNLLQTNQYTRENGWGMNNFVTYIQLNDNANVSSAEEKLADFSHRQFDTQWESFGLTIQLNMQPLRDIHLHPGLKVDVETVSRSSIYFLGLIAGFILLIAWINYINLSTARARERAREVGIKKAIGAARKELIAQFFVESVVINFIAIVLSVFLAIALLPIMGRIINKELSFAFQDIRLWFVLAGLFVVGTLASGVYPAFVLSSFKTTQVLKGQQQEGRGVSLRKALVVFQFASSLILIAGTFVVYRQINFMQSLDKGLEMDQMMIVSGPGTMELETAKQKIQVFKDEVKKIPGIMSIASSGSVPGMGTNWGADVRKSSAPLSDMKLGSVIYVDPDFIPTYHIQFVAGNNFNRELKSSMASIIINEASLSAYELGTAQEAIGQQLVLESDTATIIGVVKNYNWESLKAEVQPFLFLADDIITWKISLQLKANMIPESVAAVENLYNTILEGEPFEYHFLDDSFNAQYKGDRNFGNIFGLFAGLAITISCLGLWGLALFTTAQKLKEIGIRKVLGASVGSIVYLLSGRFVKLIIISALIALPLTWYGIRSWLNGFAFNVGMRWDLFVLPLLVLIVIALLTVSVQVLKGATTNPTRSLRSE
jgi:putative ABC transport system permease protein